MHIDRLELWGELKVLFKGPHVANSDTEELIESVS